VRGRRALTLALCVGLVGCGAQPSHEPQSSGSETPALRGRPPDFELPTLDGGSVRLSDHLGRDVILIDFWATYCEPCLRAMPELDALYQRHRARGFVVLGVSIDGADSLPEVRAEARKLGIHFPILLDHETRVVALYNPKTSAPFSVLIARDGSILQKKEGYTTGSSGPLQADIEAALSAK
jgi:peroxiredoxin